MATRYTERFRLAKPDFRTSPWSSLLNNNTDLIDALFYRTLQASNIDTYENSMTVVPGQIIYDPIDGGLWFNNTEHVTEAVGGFIDERNANPTYWNGLQIGIQAKGQWQRDTFYPIDSLVYDATEGLSGIALIAHTSPSTGSMRDDPDNWIFLVDSGGGGGVPATSVTFDDTGLTITGTNVQEGLAALDAALDAAVDDIAANTAAIVSHTASITTITSDYLSKAGNLSGIEDAATARANIGAASIADIAGDAVKYTAQTLSAPEKAQATTNIGALPLLGGTISGNLTVSGNASFGGAFSVTLGDAKIYGYGGNANQGVVRFKSDSTAYLHYDATKFSFSHLVYGSNGRLWGASDFSSVPPQATTSMRWVSGGVQTSATESAPYIMTSYDAGLGTGVRRYLQYYINGTWFTVGFV